MYRARFIGAIAIHARGHFSQWDCDSYWKYAESTRGNSYLCDR